MDFEGHTDAAGFRFAIVVARFNQLVTEALLKGALATLRRAGADEDAIDTIRVPGAWEIPVAAQWLAEDGSYDAIICLGAVIRGETPHFDHIAGEAMRGVAAVARRTGVPVATGILTTDTAAQALDRAGLKGGNKGAEAAMSAIEMASLRQQLSRQRGANSRAAAGVDDLTTKRRDSVRGRQEGEHAVEPGGDGAKS